MPLADCAEVAGEGGFVTGAVFLGMEGSCFFPNEGRAGLALCSACPLCSSLSDLCHNGRQNTVRPPTSNGTSAMHLSITNCIEGSTAEMAYF